MVYPPKTAKVLTTKSLIKENDSFSEITENLFCSILIVNCEVLNKVSCEVTTIGKTEFSSLAK